MVAGVVDNRHKEIDAGVTIGTMLMGSRRLYHLADRNPAIRLRATSYTHDAVVLSNFRRFVAINGALEVDVTGQVNAETAVGRHIGVVGGQMDFVRAANRSPEGRSIIALQSTNRDRSRSRTLRVWRMESLPHRAPRPTSSSPSTALPNCAAVRWPNGPAR
jgi:acyl-CoA hydrolase